MVPSGADRGGGRGRRGGGGAGPAGGRGNAPNTAPPTLCSLTGSHTAAHDGERAYNHTHTRTDGRITTDLSRAHQRARSSPPTPSPHPPCVHSHSCTHRRRRRRRRDSSTRAMRNNWFRQGGGGLFLRGWNKDSREERRGGGGTGDVVPEVGLRGMWGWGVVKGLEKVLCGPSKG